MLAVFGALSGGLTLVNWSDFNHLMEITWWTMAV